MNRIFIVAALSAAAFVITPALAEEHVWQTGSDYTVRTTGLDLGRAAGRARLLHRVEYASARLCRHLRPRRVREDCTAETIQQTLARAPDMLRPVLAQALRERDGVAVASR
jgi:UrcA family protein